MMAMRYHVPGLMLNRALELMLWKEATQTLTVTGVGGCGPFGLAVAAQRRGYQISVASAAYQIPFLSSVRGKDKKDVVRLLDEQLREEARSLGVVHCHANFAFEDIVQAMRRHSVPLMVMSTWGTHRARRSRWAVLTGFDARYVYFHDPYRGPSTTEAQHIRIPIPEFRRMRRSRTAVNQSLIFVSRGHRAAEAS
jgi:hypothetical protein